MKFFGNGVVWDVVKSKVLCKFEKGEFETEDKRIIDILVGLGYENDVVVEEENEEVEEEVGEEEIEIEDKIDLNDKTVVELRDIAKEKGIEGVYTKTKAELIEAIEGD